MAAIIRRAAYHLRRSPFSTLPSTSTLAVAKRNRNPHSYRALRAVFESEPDPSAAVSALVAAFRSSPRICAVRPLFSFAVSRLRRVRRQDLVVEMLSALLSRPCSSDHSPGFLAQVLSLYSDAALPDAAVEAFFNSAAKSRSDLSFSAAIAALVHNDRPSDAIRLFEDQSKEELAVCRGINSHNAYLSALCADGSVDGAFQVLDEMRLEKNGRPKPGIITYNVMLSACLKRGDNSKFSAVLELLNQSGLRSNLATFKIRISQLCRNKENRRAEELLGVMESKNVMPNLATFNELIKGFSDANDTAGAMRMFKGMKAMKRNGNEDATPNARTYMMLLRCLVKNGELEEAKSVFSESLARKAVPPFWLVKPLVEGLVKAAKAEDAKIVAAQMSAAVQGDAVCAWEKLAATILFDAEKGGDQAIDAAASVEHSG